VKLEKPRSESQKGKMEVLEGRRSKARRVRLVERRIFEI